MKQCKIGYDPIEGLVSKGELLRVAFAKLYAREQPPRDADHLAGEIHAESSRAAPGGGRGNIAGATTDIEHRHSFPNLRRIEQRRDELAGRAGPDGIVFVGDPFPTFMLELGEGIHRLPFQRPKPPPSLTTIMLKRILLPILLLGGSIALAADNPSPTSPAPSKPPSEASVKQLLEVARARKLIDSVMAQMDNLMQQSIAQATQGQKIPPKVQKNIEARQTETVAMMKELLDWAKLEPMYVRSYQKTFSQEEVDGMVAFYKTPAGQAVIRKMPKVMQNTIEEMQQMMGPVMQKIQKTQQDVVAEMKAESKNKGG
jgi:hypothetical protein